MKNTIRPSTFAVATLTLLALAPAANADKGVSDAIKRGGQLVAVGGCVDCHTPFKMGPSGPEKDMSRGMSGHPEGVVLPPPPALSNEWNWAGAATGTAFVGPWGTTYSANLTPDRETGMGAWTAKDFIQAMRTGKHIGVARPIMPPMPWQDMAGLPERDLKAIYAYLMAQPAVKNKVPAYVPPAGDMR